MNDNNVKELSTRERAIVQELPGTTKDIGGALNITDSTVRDHISAARNAGVDIEYDASTMEYSVVGDDGKVDFSSDEPTPTETSTQYSKAEVTHKARKHASNLESEIVGRLKDQPPIKTKPPIHIPGNEDIVFHISDVHMGDVVESESTTTVEDFMGREKQVPLHAFNQNIAEASFNHVTEKIIEIADLMGGCHRFDEVHGLYGGDFVTGENIYFEQPHDIESLIDTQIGRAVTMMVNQIKALSAKFESVQIVCQPGNHGNIKSRGTSSNANYDRVAYLWVRDRVQDLGLDNVRMVVEGPEYYRNFEMRGGKMKGHLRHGHDAPKHIEATRMSESKWRGWWAKHRFDTAYLGHYHNSRRAYVLNQHPVTMAPSMKPGSEFAERIGSPDCSDHRKLATVHGVSDKRPITWEYLIDDTSMDIDFEAATLHSY